MVHKDPTNNLADTTDNSRKEDGAAEFDLSLLQPLGKAPLGGGIPTYILGSQDKVEEFMNLHPSFRPVYKISDEDTQERRELALNYAARGLDRPELTKLLQAGRILFKQVFVKELGLLDHLMYQPLRGEYIGSDDEGDEVQMLMGKKLPSFPHWGDIGDSYRAQVEHFLTRLASVHDFLTGTIRNANNFAEDFAYTPSAAVKSTHKPKPKQEKEQDKIGESISTMVRTKRKAEFSSSNKSARVSVPQSSGKRTQNMLPRTTQRLSDMWSDDGEDVVADAGGEPGPGGDSSDNEGSGSDNDGHHRQCRGRNSQPPQPPQVSLTTSPTLTSAKFQFDMRLKFDAVPTWDGDTNTIVKWINKVNDLAKYSSDLRKQLGSVVPRRLEGSASMWFYSLPKDHRNFLERDWRNLREEIASYYMNRRWMETIEYYICKCDLLTTVYELDDSELIMEVMDGAPTNWTVVLSPRTYETARELQSAIRYYEDTLMDLDLEYRRTRDERDRSNRYQPTAPE
ncbi:hypothetical protein BT96DRAFT_1071730 [Gymnopus androsaceus JB14]|uniref:Retrotransposon gag domain-containing protein n=1 Tax=Gymnopus androsaceus JB14 TaxID=1447944 RepID=A0A6A4GTA1_9AGAR|nr:hypothetical protein BT96DRAFT_1071730 [Gymnopus androsaceus JB14]